MKSDRVIKCPCDHGARHVIGANVENSRVERAVSFRMKMKGAGKATPGPRTVGIVPILRGC